MPENGTKVELTGPSPSAGADSFRANPRAVILDFDRTLIDLYPDRKMPRDLREEVLRVVTEWGVSREVLKPFLRIRDGYTLWMALACSWRASALNEALQGLDGVFLDAEMQAAEHSHLEAGARQLLGALEERSVPVGIVTSNDPAPTSRALELHGLLEPVSVIIGRQTPVDPYGMKPSGRPVLAALEALRVAPSPEGVLVGDSVDDMLAASRAGLTPIGVATGDYGADQLRESGAVVVVQNLKVLADYLFSTEL